MYKQNFSRFVILPALALSLGFTSACQAKTKAAQSPLPAINTADLAASALVHYPESSQYQKPGAPVRYAYSMPKNIAVGQPITFDVTISEPFSSGDMVVNCTTRGDVRLHGNSGNDSFSMSGDNKHVMQVSFVAEDLGRHYIQFQASVESNEQGGVRTRYFSIPVQVGPVQPLAPHPNLKIMPNGERVIAMPATEEIK